MAIKDSIVNLKKGLRTTLTNVPALIDTLVRGLDGVAEAAEEESTYSTTEKVVGNWIDGSEIYEKVINFGALPNNTTKNVDHGIANIGTVIAITGVAQTATNILPIPYVSLAALNEYGIIITVSNTAVSISTGRDRSDYNAVVTLRYTKASATRSPEENDTKNGDEEKNNEEVKNER